MVRYSWYRQLHKYLFCPVPIGNFFKERLGKGQTPSPAPFIHCHLKLYHKKYVSIEVFLYPSILQTDCSKYLFKRSFRLHRFRAPPHCENGLFFKRTFLGGIFDFRHVVNIIYIAGPAEGPEEEALGVRQTCHSC